MIDFKVIENYCEKQKCNKSCLFWQAQDNGNICYYLAFIESVLKMEHKTKEELKSESYGPNAQRCHFGLVSER